MKLYHVTRNINLIDTFSPRIPSYLEANESFIPRVCLSDSIENCLSAIFYHWFDTNYFLKHCGKGWFNEIFHPFSELLIYEFNTDDISNENILCPTDVFNKFRVFDAIHNSEYCVINQSITPCSVKLVNLESVSILLKTDFINNRYYRIHSFKDLHFSKILDLDNYMEEITKYYCNLLKYGYKQKAIYDLNFQILSRDADTPVKITLKNILKKLDNS